MIDAYYVPIEEIKKVTWAGDAKAFDIELYNLGQGHDEFIIVNTDYDETGNANYYDYQFYKNIKSLPFIRSDRCIVWKYNGIWIAKYFTKNWIAEQKYWEVDLSLEWEINPDIDIKFDTPSITDLYDLNYEMTWYLDPKFSNGDKIWVMKCHLQNTEPLGNKDMGYISPTHVRVIRNPDIPDIEYNNNFNVPWYDLKYECTWYLDSKYNPSKDKVWAVKVKLRGGGIKPTKDMGYTSPKIIYNPDLPKLDYVMDNHIPYYDLVYTQIWMIDSSITNDIRDVWAAKISPANPKGTKIVGKIKINNPEQLDVIFISYNEPNAEANWARVKELAPYAKRVDGVKGIVNAHKCAAELAESDMFYVVDGDAYLNDGWDFKFQPSIFDRDCVHVWRSQNPVNGLIYGYGGVKLLPKELTLAVDPLSTDMTTSISSKFKVMSQVSNTTEFNTDAFNTFKSAFRECTKLASGILKRQLNRESKKRLEIWCSVGNDKPFGDWAIKGALAGKKFGQDNTDNTEVLANINNTEWLQEQFNLLLADQALNIVLLD